MGSRAKILKYLLSNVGRVLTSDEIREASGNVNEWARRLRELRDEYGYQIRSHNDLATLKPGEYVLHSRDPVAAVPRDISKETRAFVLDRDGSTCQLCGLSAGDPDPIHPGRKIKLTMGHVKQKDQGGTDDADNLRAECTNCNEGLQNTAAPRPDRLALLKAIRRAAAGDQKHALDWLLQKFKAGK